MRYLLTEEKAEKKKPEAIELGALIAYERPQPTHGGLRSAAVEYARGEVIQ